MILVKKFALVVSLVFSGALALAAVAVAAGGGGLSPGAYTFTDKEAMATFGTLRGGPPGQQGFSVIVDRGLNSFRNKGSEASRTVISSTMVSLTIFDDAGSATFGCFMVNSADFSVSKDLQAANLHTTLTADEVCPGAGAPLTKTGASTPFAVGGGGAALPLPITLDIAWTGLGVTSVGTDHSTSRCLDYSTDFNSTFKTSNANATGTISAINGSFATPFGDVISSDVKANIKGVPQTACLPQ
ncbi:MAG TPA: hypothetical protein VGJ79_07420 [Candidatus Dormibacteraeota bacterium]